MVDEVTELDFFALDIETDNSDGGGLDPGIGQITAIALLGKDWLWHQQASSEQMERAMLVQFADALVWSNRPIIATWNGGAFDFPFLTQRMEHHGVGVPWVLSDRTDREPKYAPTPPYDAVQNVDPVMLHHVDLAYFFGPEWCERHECKWGLKYVADQLGLVPEFMENFKDAGASISESPANILGLYNINDTMLTRDLFHVAKLENYEKLLTLFDS